MVNTEAADWNMLTFMGQGFQNAESYISHNASNIFLFDTFQPW